VSSLSENVTTAEINSAAAQDLQTAVSGSGGYQAIVTGSAGSSAITAISDLTVKSVGSAMTESLADSTFSTVGSSAGSPASRADGSTAVNAGSDQGGGFVASDAASKGSTLIAGQLSPSSQALVTQMSSSGAPPPGGAPADAASSAVPSPPTTLLAAAPGDNGSSTDTGTLGARGPPVAPGPVLIVAVSGGPISAGDPTLTFAPSSPRDDANVSVTVSTAPADGLVSYPAANNLTAVNTATGEVILQLASAPQPTIDVGTAGAPAPQINYLPATGDPVAIRSTLYPTTGPASAGLSRSSTQVATANVTDSIFAIGPLLHRHVTSARAPTRTLSPTGDLSIGTGVRPS
jgi:hypothetical protein